MKFRASALLTTLLAASLALTACGGGRGATEPQNTSEGSTSQAVTEEGNSEEGFPQDATIGVALPWLGTQNWMEAQTMFDAQLTDAGFKPLIQAADNKVPQQQQQIEAMIEQGAKVIVVGPVDGTQLGSALDTAKDAGVTVIGYDRLIQNTDAVSGIVQFGSVRTGELQGQALLDGLEAEKGEPPYNIELFGGGPADPNAPDFFKGAMSVLQPKIDDGTLVVKSGQTDFTQAATQDWDNARAQARMDTLMSNYSGDEIDGVLSPNDGIARAIITSVKQAGQSSIPVLTGLDAENESIVWIAKGDQYSTVAKPTEALVGRTVELIKSLQAGDGMPEPDETTDNGAIEIGLYQLDPVVITKANASEVLANDPDRLKLFEDNLS